jgi:hypothetical protein
MQCCLLVQCKKKEVYQDPVVPATALQLSSIRIDQANPVPSTITNNVSLQPTIIMHFSNSVDRSTVPGSVTVRDNSLASVTLNISYANSDSTLVLVPVSPLRYLTNYQLSATRDLKSSKGGALDVAKNYSFNTQIDSSYKFPVISDSALLDLVQQQTFKYFWNFGHPVSGMARERNTSGETVTTGGTGFGIMTLPVAINRNFITRSEGLSRIQQLVGFLKNTAQKFHGAYPHWMNGTTGIVQPFSQKDDGADLVETSYLMQGLTCVREFFNQPNTAETNLRNDINTILNAVEWDWFTRGGQNVLYWHWSPNYGWDMNFPIRGWNEGLITYVMAASSVTHPISRVVYDNGFAQNGGIRNNNSYYGYTLPLGPTLGGPLFFSHYSFLGINPHGLTDTYANYWTQNQNHTLINYSYSVSNPMNYFGYSNNCWGLTACDVINGYNACSPTSDPGVIAPTAAISAMPYTPDESMRALKFYYYILGNKLWGEYGFYDAFSLHQNWFASSTLAIDQGPIIIMIENYRSGLLWNLFTGATEIKNGLRTLGFSAPYL